ncbi:c-type heme family protein [Maridesulfovibrio sp.]|uniref:c-type heme family protein n=1 Tax=Maridesulfovibrio sp. TaxID=2795000 RepID=UPI003BAA01C3
MRLPDDSRSATSGKKKFLQVAGLFVLITMVVWVILFYVARQYVVSQAEDKIKEILLVHKGMHHYVQEIMHPALYKYKNDNEIKKDFYAPELFSSSFIIRNLHGFYNQEKNASGEAELYYKMAANNPRNKVNKADLLEQNLITMFNKNREIKEYRDVVSINGTQYLYVAIPFLENNKGCLTCHGKCEDAPAQLRERYKGAGGYNEELGVIRAVISVRAPLGDELFDISIIGGALFSGVAALIGLLFFSTRLKGVVNRRTAKLKQEIEVRIQAEQEVEKLRNYLSNVIDSMPSQIVGVTPEGIITQWNSGAGSDFGISKEDALGQNVEQIAPRLADEMEKVRKAIQSRTIQVESKRIRRENGDVHYEDVTVYPLIANGVEGAVIRIDDVTGRVHLEQVLVQSEKMMSVGGLAAGMAHEINNPLAGILGSAFNIKKRVFSDLKSNRSVADECGVHLELVQEYLRKRKVDRMLDSIQESGKRAAAIVDNMLSFSRKSDGQMQLFDLSSLMDRTLELAANDYNLKKFYDFRQIKIIREYQPGMKRVFCDGNEIQQVFLNLFKNGAEAMTEKQYSDTSPTFHCRVYEEKGMAVVEIEDNGPGMDEVTCSRIFEPFYTTKAVGRGTGLGLSVSYFIITDQHNGNMAVESDPAEGTKFIIRLPIRVGAGG